MSEIKLDHTPPDVFSLITFPVIDDEIITFLESIPEAEEDIKSCWSIEEESQLRSLVSMSQNIDARPFCWEPPPLSWTEIADKMNVLSRAKKLNDVDRVYTAEMVERQWAKMKEWEDVECWILALLDQPDFQKKIGAKGAEDYGKDGGKYGMKRRMSI
jgi:hypothetical protein